MRCTCRAPRRCWWVWRSASMASPRPRCRYRWACCPTGSGDMSRSPWACWSSSAAAWAHGIHGIIIGRVLQGMGAVSGASQALAADHSRDDNRSKVMGIIGISIGAAFVLAIVLGAPLARIGGLAGLFGLTAVLALAAIGLLWVLVPRLAEHRAPAAARPGSVLRMLVKPQLTVLNVSVFMMHTMLTAAFVALPLMLKQDTGI